MSIDLQLLQPLTPSARIPNLMTDDGLPTLNPGKLLTGANIKRARKAKRITKLALAQACGVSERAIYNWEHDIHVPEGVAREKLLEVLDLELPEGVVGRGRVVKLPADATNRHELEMIRQHVRMIGMLLDQMLDGSKA